MMNVNIAFSASDGREWKVFYKKRQLKRTRSLRPVESLFTMPALARMINA
jgi:hypothetical protein